MEKHDIVDLAKIYIQLHKLNENDTNFLIERVESFKTEQELWDFLVTGGSTLKEDIGGHSLSKDTSRFSDYMVSKLWKYLYSEVTGGEWETTKNQIHSIWKEFAQGANIAAFAISMLALTAIVIKVIKMLRVKYLTQANRECKGLVGVRKDLCDSRYDLMVKKMEMNVVKKALAVCGETKDPSSCKQKMGSRLDKIRVDITKKQSEIKDLMEKAKNKKR